MKPLTEDEAFLERLRAEARYARERRDLYRAKVHGPRPTSFVRLRELERECDLAAERLDRTELKRTPTSPT